MLTHSLGLFKTTRIYVHGCQYSRKSSRAFYLYDLLLHLLSWNCRMWIVPDSREETEAYAEKEHQERHLQLVNDYEKKSVSCHFILICSYFGLGNLLNLNDIIFRLGKLLSVSEAN